VNIKDIENKLLELDDCKIIIKDSNIIHGFITKHTGTPFTQSFSIALNDGKAVVNTPFVGKVRQELIDHLKAA